MKIPVQRFTAIGAAAIAACFGALAPASAALVVGGAAQATAGAEVAATQIDSTPTAFVASALVSNDQGIGSARGFALTTGPYAAASYAEGIATGNGLANFLEHIVNDSGVAQRYSLVFKVYGGTINTVSQRDLLTGETLDASYNASIKVNGSSVFESSASISRDGAAVSSIKSGFDLNPNDDGSDGFYAWSTQFVEIDLGILLPGDSIDVLAALGDTSLANVGTYTDDCGGGGYGDTLRSNATAVCFKGRAQALYGDPQDIGSTATDVFAFNATPVNGVPEPASLALFGLAGVVGAASRRRRRRDRAG